jgi:hypothetical protein
MTIRIFICMCFINALHAKNEDPFHQKPTGIVKSASVLKKYRYHGFVKINQTVFAILKMVGADYELIRMGMHKGLGQVIVIEATRICIRKSGKSYCLSRSDTAKNWEGVHV